MISPLNHGDASVVDVLIVGYITALEASGRDPEASPCIKRAREIALLLRCAAATPGDAIDVVSEAPIDKACATTLEIELLGRRRLGDAVSGRDYDAERRLPLGKTCGDCIHGPRCDALFGAVRRGFTSCDFWPSIYCPTPKPDQTAAPCA